MTKLNKLVEEIGIDKEILSTLPQNNKRNTKIYADKVDELLQKYKGYEQNLLSEIGRRSQKFDNIKISSEINKIENEVKNIEKYLYLIEENDSAFEKMGLDREISSLTYYYKKDLEKVNNTIKFSIEKFKEAGIDISSNDFIFNKYVNEYVLAVLQNQNEEDLNTKFEEIYWKCPEIISYIEVNIRHIFLNNEKMIDKYYKIQKEKLLKLFTEETISNRYLEIKKQNIESYKKDKFLILDSFLSGKLQIKDYTKSSILDIIKKFTDRTDLAQISDEELEKILVNLIKFLNTLIEYQNYNKFRFIIDKVREAYKEKDMYKNSYNKTKKEIANLEKKAIKLGKTSLFKKDVDKNLVEQTKLIKDIKEKYKQLDVNEACEKIVTVLNDHSSLFDALQLASIFYKYLFKCIIENQPDIQEEEINKTVDELKEFINWPYFTILNNVEMNEQKDIMYIIKDRYNLLNINVTKEDLEIDNLEAVINTLKKCETYYYIMKNNIDLKVVQETYEFKKILNGK